METKEDFESLTITFTFTNGEIRRSLKDDLELSDPALIDDYLIKHPANTAYWNAMWQMSKSRVEKLKYRLEVYYAELDKNLREKALEDGEKLSEPQIKQLIISDSKYRKIKEQLLDLQEQDGLLKAAVEALGHMKSSLISFSSNLREEKKGLPRFYNEEKAKATLRFNSDMKEKKEQPFTDDELKRIREIHIKKNQEKV